MQISKARYFRFTGGLTALTLLAACASSSENIETAYVSPLQYQHHDCEQIGVEAQRVSARAAQLAGQVDDNATNDAVAMGVGLVLFWPALFFIEGDGPEANEYARLKGEHEALRQAAAEKMCDFPDSPTAADSEAEIENENTDEVSAQSS